MPIYLLCAVPTVAKRVDKTDGRNSTMTPVLEQMAVPWRVCVCWSSNTEPIFLFTEVVQFTQAFFSAFYEGQHPKTDAWGQDWPEGSFEAAHAGVALRNGLFGVVWHVTGDLDFYAEETVRDVCIYIYIEI